jgi:glycosyltransferase involved in cell wall biosynthesis
MRRLLVIDPVCPGPYDSTTLNSGGLGGAEATVVRVAEKLAEKHEVIVAQRSRSGPEARHGARYVGFDALGQVGRPDAVIVLRNPLALKEVRARFRSAELHLWMHDRIVRPGMIWREWAMSQMTSTRARVVFVSRYHHDAFLEEIGKSFLDPVFKRPALSTAVVYNPIDEGLRPDDTPVDKSKLIFFSSPHKGLAQVLDIFDHVRAAIPELRLHVANPGYEKSRLKSRENVINMGSLSHREIIAHVRSSLCTFYPNSVFPETFGLVLAESNAVGTPVIAHAFGAAPEVVNEPGQLLDATDREGVRARVLSWYNGSRPRVGPNEKFRLSNVARAWEELLGLS